MQSAEVRPLNRPVPEVLVNLGLETEGVREKLLLSRTEARSELVRALGSTGFAGFLIGLETWGIIRGAPFFGWLVPVLFVGFAVYFWRRRGHAKDQVSFLEEELRVLEAEREGLSKLGGPPVRSKGLAMDTTRSDSIA
jgi:hypothetical protein